MLQISKFNPLAFGGNTFVWHFALLTLVFHPYVEVSKLFPLIFIGGISNIQFTVHQVLKATGTPEFTLSQAGWQN